MTRVLLWQWGRRGGGPRYTFELARALAALGQYEVHLSLSLQSEIFKEFEALGLPGCHVKTYSGVPSLIVGTLRLLKLRRAFWRYVKKQNIDVVVCTMSHLWNVPMLVGRLKTVPYLLVLHDALPHAGDDVLFRRWLLKQEVACSDGVVTLSEHVRGILCRDYGYPGDRTWVIPHGIFPYTSAVSNSHSVTGHPLRVLFFGRIMPYKGLDILLGAYAALRAQRQDIELIIAGPGDLGRYSIALDGLEGVHVDNRWIPEHEIGQIFRKADLVVLPYREASQSGVIATAFAAGLPVVVTPTGGLVEQVQHEVTGLICKEVSSTSLADAITRMLDEPDLRVGCGERALREVTGVLAWPSIASRFTEALDVVVAKRQRGGPH